MQKENPETSHKWNKQQEKSLLISNMRECTSWKDRVKWRKILRWMSARIPPKELSQRNEKYRLHMKGRKTQEGGVELC